MTSIPINVIGTSPGAPGTTLNENSTLGTLVTNQNMRFSFPKKKRLVSNRQFKAVLDRGRRLSNGLLTLYMAENDCGYSRLGISVKKSCGNAVVRNRLKRLLREAFRQSQDRIPAGFDYLLMISPRWLKKSRTGKAARLPTFEHVKDSFLALAKQMIID